MLLLIQDTILIGICNSLTSLYAGLVVFGVVGFISVQTGTDIDKVWLTNVHASIYEKRDIVHQNSPITHEI